MRHIQVIDHPIPPEFMAGDWEDRQSHLRVVAETLRARGYGALVEGDFVGVYLHGRALSATDVALALADEALDELVSCEQVNSWVRVTLS